MCFDYLMLKDKFDLNLESVSAERADQMEQDAIAAEASSLARKKEPNMFETTEDRPF